MNLSEETRLQLAQEINKAIVRAAEVLDLKDLDDASEEEQLAAWDERHHCGTCIMRTVMEEIWPEIEAYVDFLRLQVQEAVDGPVCCSCCN